MDAAALITEARSMLQDGKSSAKGAARLLTDAVYESRGPDQLERIRTLAEQGQAEAGVFGKGRWKEVLRLADLRMQKMRDAGL